MSITPVAATGPSRSSGTGPRPRVRHQAREAVALMVFSAVASSVIAGCLLLLTALGHQG